MKTEFVKRMIVKVLALTIILALTLTGTAYAETTASDSQKLDTYYSLAINYISRENYEKAMEYLNACLDYCDEESNPDLCADVHLKKGCVHTMTGDYENAVKELDEAIRIQDALTDAWLVKTQAYSENGQNTEAIESLEKYIELTKDNSMYETLSQLYLQAGDVQKANEAYSSFAEASSESDVEASYLKGVYELGLGLYAEAAEDFEACLNDTTYGVSSAYNTGVCRMNIGDYENALVAFNQCAEAGGTYDGINYNRGVCYMTQGSFEEAIEAFAASIDNESYKEDATYNRAVCYMSLGNYDEAIADYTGYIDNRAAALSEVNEAGEESKPESVVDLASYYRGVCYLSKGEYDKAVEDFSTCLENGVAEADSLFNRGLSYLQGGKFEAAVDDFTACIDNASNVDEAHFYRSYAYRYLGQNEEALQDLTACIENEYNLAQSYYQRAQVYNDLGDNDGYVEDLEASLAY